jgi:hypothetical protein
VVKSSLQFSPNALYTVGFQLDNDKATRASCATSSDHNYTASQR